MRKSVLAVVVAALCLPGAGAARSGDLKACSLVSTKQGASLGVTKSCVGKTLPGTSGVVADANWGSPTNSTAALALTVTTFNSTSSVAWQTNMQVLKVMAGTSKKVSGIGSIAYESGGDGGNLASIHFVKGKRVVAFSWYSKKPQTSLKVFTAIAKSIAAQI